MILVLLAAIQLITFQNGIAHAQDLMPANAQTEWSQYYPGNAFVLDPQMNLEKIIATPEVRCVGIQRSIIDLALEYGQKAYWNKTHATKQIQKTILGKLTSLELAKDSCFESAARAYLLVSIHLLHPFSSNTGMWHQIGMINGHPFQDNLNVTLLAAALINHADSQYGRLVNFITPEIRSKNLKGIWDEKVGQNYRVAAGYACGSKQIYIDPYKPPFDLAATFLHEIDHLFRDRVAPADLDVNHLNLQIVMDETLASVTSVLFQRRMREFQNQVKLSFQRPFSNRWAKMETPYLIDGDNTLFRNAPDSPINQIWSIFEKAYYNQSSPGVNMSSGNFLSQTFLRAGSHPGYYRIQKPLEQINDIYQVIHRGYFSGLALSPSELSLLDPDLHSLEANDTLNWFLENTHLKNYVAPVPIEKPIDADSLKNTYWIERRAEHLDKNNESQLPPGDYRYFIFYYNMSGFFERLDSIKGKLFDDNEPSAYCSRYTRGLAAGELDHYVGKQFKYGETGVKPGETGVKPGETGVKPGETGVKPEMSGLKPCLDLSGQL